MHVRNPTPPAPNPTPCSPNAGTAAHIHASDLANVPRSHRLVESSRQVEHILRRASTRDMLLSQPPCKQEACVAPNPQKQAAAHPHVNDLANVPCLHGLVESSRPAEHILRRASTCDMLLPQPPCKQEVYVAPNP